MQRNIWTTLLLITLFTAPVQAAKLYKWTDEEGNVHFSQKPPTAPDKDEVLQQPEPVPEEAVMAPAEAPEPSDLEASQQAAELCDGLFRDLERYQENKQITDAEGNVMVISPEMREAKIAEINAQLDESCR